MQILSDSEIYPGLLHGFGKILSKKSKTY